MSRMLILVGSVLLITSTGFSEILITAQDYAVDSDVVLESAVSEIKSAPRDTADVIGDSIKSVSDEVITASKGVAAVFKKDLHAKAQKSGELAVENAWDSSNDILFRSYTVSDEIGSVLMSGVNDGAGEDNGDGSSVDVSGFFKDIKFPRKTSAYYLPKLNNLFVRQTLENILNIEDVLADYQDARQELMGHQVEIEAKFVEVNQNTLNELGFKWNFAGKGTSTASGATVANGSGDANLAKNIFLPAQDILNQGLRTAASALGAGAASDTLTLTKSVGSLQWSLVINALEQSDDADVLSAPRVVVRDGGTAKIRVGEEQMMPKSFDVDNQSTSPWVIPSDWNLELMGVQLEVSPQLREGGLIDLKINPQVQELVGYDSYQLVPSYTGGVTSTVELNTTLPYYRLRKMETQVTVADGSTVGMGGLIYDKLETFRDKVPVLGSIPLIGRLFRSEGEKSVKRNLMIFVTATQVDVNGRRSSDLALKK
ncbi:MAG: hypothetical protein PHP93_03575 [Kiritimatiellales bacterium]|nr:hypothetical protein [Kiritimatiellales bacterium]